MHADKYGVNSSIFLHVLKNKVQCFNPPIIFNRKTDGAVGLYDKKTNMFLFAEREAKWKGFRYLRQEMVDEETRLGSLWIFKGT